MAENVESLSEKIVRPWLQHDITLR